MKTIAVINQKGGVAKTTTAANLGSALAQTGRRVLMVDLDPQAHLSLHLGVEPQSQRGIYGLLTGQTTVTDALTRLNPSLAFLPAHIDLAAADVELAGVVGRERILSEALAQLAGDFDLAILDCPPSLGVLTLNGLASASDLIIPLQAHFFALQGVGKLLETVSLVQQRINPRLNVLGLVVCMYESNTRLATEVVNDLEAFVAGSRGSPVPWRDAVVFRTRIRRNIKLAECPGHGKSIFDYAPESNGAADYKSLTDELLALLGGTWAAAPAVAEVVPEAPQAQAV